MTINLDDIQSRINDGIYGDDLTDTTSDDAFSALAALLNEVKQLRAEASYLRACVPPVHPADYGHEAWTETVRDAVAKERAAVVAWLRERHADTQEWDGYDNATSRAYDRAADAIERGEHRREETK